MASDNGTNAVSGSATNIRRTHENPREPRRAPQRPRVIQLTKVDGSKPTEYLEAKTNPTFPSESGYHLERQDPGQAQQPPQKNNSTMTPYHHSTNTEIAHICQRIVTTQNAPLPLLSLNNTTSLDMLFISLVNGAYAYLARLQEVEAEQDEDSRAYAEASIYKHK